MRYLTKSRFTTALSCPAKLAYSDNPNFANAKSEDTLLLALAEGGHVLGALARTLFPDGVEIDAVGHVEQVQQTRDWLLRGDCVLFEAAFSFGNLFIRADLLRKTGSDIEIYEVKAKSYDSSQGESQIIGKRGGFTSSFKPYLYDIAFQRYVVRAAHPGANVSTFLVLADKAKECSATDAGADLRVRKLANRTINIEIGEKLRDGNLAREILHILPVDSYIDKLVSEPIETGGYSWPFEVGIAALEASLAGQFIAPRPGSHCKDCEFRASANAKAKGLLDGRHQCWSGQFQITEEEIELGTIFDLYNSRLTDKLVEKGKIKLSELEPEDVGLKEEFGKISNSKRQWLQCEESRGNVDRPVLLLNEIRDELEKITYPLHFIDFETSMPSLPFYAGMRPYELLFFQFSHHFIDEKGQVLHKSENLEDGKFFPNFESLRKLKVALEGDSGSVLHWWTHERTVLREVRSQLVRSSPSPPDIDALLTFIDSLVGTSESKGRLFDLGQHLIHPYAFLPGTRGSSSIKKVLLSMIKLSPTLQSTYATADYGTRKEVGSSHNFNNQAWVRKDANGNFLDPYALLAGRFADELLDEIELSSTEQFVADGGAAMVAYNLLQLGTLEEDERTTLRNQMLRYCELDTLAMVMVWQGLAEHLQTN